MELTDQSPTTRPVNPLVSNEKTDALPLVKVAFEPEPIPMMVPLQLSRAPHPDGEPLMSMVILEVELAETVVFVVETRSQPVPGDEVAFEKFQM
jgi:hypothetical protein